MPTDDSTTPQPVRPSELVRVADLDKWVPVTRETFFAIMARLEGVESALTTICEPPVRTYVTGDGVTVGVVGYDEDVTDDRGYHPMNHWRVLSALVALATQ